MNFSVCRSAAHGLEWGGEVLGAGTGGLVTGVESWRGEALLLQWTVEALLCPPRTATVGRGGGSATAGVRLRWTGLPFEFGLCLGRRELDFECGEQAMY